MAEGVQLLILLVPHQTARCRQTLILLLRRHSLALVLPIMRRSVHPPRRPLLLVEHFLLVEDFGLSIQRRRITLQHNAILRLLLALTIGVVLVVVVVKGRVSNCAR